MSRTARILAVVAGAAALAGCKGYTFPPIKEPLKLNDGTVISTQTLEAGRMAYMQYCRTCHGDKGDGKGPSAPGLHPPPRDFTLATFKFAAVAGGTLPHDEDFIRIVKGGLHGTAMLAWQVPDVQLKEIIQYIKTFSPRWQQEPLGDHINWETAKDPWAGKEHDGEVRGKKVYHGLAQCLGCHPSYASKQYIYDASKELTSNGVTDFRDDMYASVLKDSDYGVKILPPDFTHDDLRSVRDDPKLPPAQRDEQRLRDLFRIIASGVGGTAMPTWEGSLPDDDIWALAHYVDSLVRIKNSSQVAELEKANTEADKGWKAPADTGDQKPQ